MAEIITQDTAVLSAQARLEPNISVEHPFSHEFNFNIAGKYTYSGSIMELVQSWLAGCGKVDLVSLELKFKMLEEKQTMQIGFCDLNSSLTIDQVAMKLNGVDITSNARTVGDEYVKNLIPEDTLSRQLQPISSMLLATKIMIAKDEKVRANLIIRLKVHGVIRVYATLKV